MRKVFTLACSAVALALPLAGCGGGGSHTTTQSNNKPLSLSQACPSGKSFMGCRQKTFKSLPKLVLTAPPPGLEYPDVSVWQGAVNWPAVANWQKSHGWHPAAIWKMGEYVLDNQASRNASETARLGFWRAGYWFIRNTGCSHEASQIIAAARQENLKVVVFDSEVPEARGYDACLAQPVKNAGLVPVEYTSPGSNPDGSNNPGLDLWVASFGPSHSPCLFTCNVGVAGKQSILAWQFTDGQFGPVVNIPGIGHDDVNVDYGITKLGVTPPKPKPAPAPAPTPTPKPKPSTCTKNLRYNLLTQPELALVLKYDGARKHPQKYAGYLSHVLEPELKKLADAVWNAAHGSKPAAWGLHNRGVRFQMLFQREHGAQLDC